MDREEGLENEEQSEDQSRVIRRGVEENRYCQVSS